MQVTPFRGIRCDVGQMSLKCPKKRKKPFSVRENDFFDLCAHLGSNQGPKDYESSTLTNWAIGAGFCKPIKQDLVAPFDDAIIDICRDKTKFYMQKNENNISERNVRPFRIDWVWAAKTCISLAVKIVIKNTDIYSLFLSISHLFIYLCTQKKLKGHERRYIIAWLS